MLVYVYDNGLILMVQQRCRSITGYIDGEQNLIFIFSNPGAIQNVR